MSQLIHKGKTSHLQGHALDIRQARFMVAVFPHVVDTIARAPLCYAPRVQCPVSTPLLISGRKQRVYSGRGEGWRAISGKYDVKTGCNVGWRLELPTNPRELSYCPENELNKWAVYIVSNDS